MENKKDIKRFISNIANKEYSEANASLQQMVENKIKIKIKNALSPKK